MKTDEIIKNNSEILFVFEAKNTNPNGDPDDENKPRMDYDRSLNLVSDVRLKRYIRDYLENTVINNEIFVSKINNATVDATKRLKGLIEKNIEEILKNDELKELVIKGKDTYKADEKKLSKHLDWLLSKLIDVRFFGATMPIKAGDTGKGSSITFTGPIQFNWGYSLNKVLGPIDSSTITSTFAGAGEDQGTMGKDYRVGYSIIAFHGIVSANRAKYTKLTDDDINIFDDAMINILKTEATTRSKIGQTPLIYMRIEYNGNEYFMGDLRRYIKLIDLSGNEIKFEDSGKLDWDKYKLDLTKLSSKINATNEKIRKVYLWINEDIDVVGLSIDENKIITLPVVEKSEKQ